MKHTLYNLMESFDRLVVLDTETTGIDATKEEIIEIGAQVFQMGSDGLEPILEYNQLIALSPGRSLPPFITNLTGITPMDLQEKGISKEQACQDLEALLSNPKTLFAAYNAQFDLSFVYHTLLKYGNFQVLRNCKFLDVLTIYKDRRSYPHKLANALEAYDLTQQFANSHRAIDDVKATTAVLESMAQERDDLEKYINLFGFNPKYGVNGKKIGSVCYRCQSYGQNGQLYAE